jgi:small-conductance mechanosensitive channel
MNEYIVKIIISTIFVTIIYPSFRFIVNQLIDNVSKLNLYDESNSKMIKKTTNILIIVVITMIIISMWGVDKENVLLALSSIFAIIGVALFAQWSILSNVTAGIIIFFSQQFRIGDKIRIHDKDFPIEATIKDIKTFYIHLETDEGEKITYPNNMILQKGISLCSTTKDSKAKKKSTIKLADY